MKNANQKTIEAAGITSTRFEVADRFFSCKNYYDASGSLIAQVGSYGGEGYVDEETGRREYRVTHQLDGLMAESFFSRAAALRRAEERVAAWVKTETETTSDVNEALIVRRDDETTARGTLPGGDFEAGLAHRSGRFNEDGEELVVVMAKAMQREAMGTSGFTTIEGPAICAKAGETLRLIAGPYFGTLRGGRWGGEFTLTNAIEELDYPRFYSFKATETETETETARYDFEEKDAGIKVRRNGVAIGLICKASGRQPVALRPYEVTLLGSRVTCDASVIEAYAADVEDGVIELRSESLDELKRFVEEVVTGFAKPVSTTVVDGDNVYLVRRVNPGNEYGVKLRNRPPLVADKVLIEFYVKETPGYSWDKLEEIHGPLGYFVSRYHWSTLHFSRGDSEILDLGGYEISREKVSGALDSLYDLNLHVNAP